MPAVQFWLLTLLAVVSVANISGVAAFGQPLQTESAAGAATASRHHRHTDIRHRNDTKHMNDTGNGGGSGGPTPATCSPYCAQNQCVLAAAGKYKCLACINGFEPTVDGSCACPAGTSPGKNGATVMCQDCPVGFWCPGGTTTAGGGISSCSEAAGCGNTGCMTTTKTRCKQRSECTNSPSFYYIQDTMSAAPCPRGTYSPGLQYQTACTGCPAGFVNVNDTTNASTTPSCKLKPGYYLQKQRAVPCPKGTYNPGYNLVGSCKKCATNVITAGTASTSKADCRYLRRGVEAATWDAATGEVTSTTPCRLNAYCPGNARFPGWIGCPRAKWTKSRGSYNSLQCLVPPGYYLPADPSKNITKCATGAAAGRQGTYKAGWATARECTACGDGIYSQPISNVTVYDPYTESQAQEAVADTPNACFVHPGMAVQYTFSNQSGGYVFVGQLCDKSEDINKDSNYGYPTISWGLKAKPCRRCPGIPTVPGPYGGYTACELPPGYAAVLFSGALLMTTGYQWTSILSVVECPVGNFCPGGDPSSLTNTTGKACKCPEGTTTNSTKATSASECVAFGGACGENQELTADGKACQCKAGYQTRPRTIYQGGNLTCDACSVGYYSPALGAVCRLCDVGLHSLTAAAYCSPCPVRSTWTGTMCSCDAGCTATGPWPYNMTCACPPVQCNSTIHHVATPDNMSCICAEGYVPQDGTSYTNNNLLCQACPAGAFASQGDQTCQWCPAGQYTPSLGSGSCFACPNNSTANADKTTCYCDPGCSMLGQAPNFTCSCPVTCSGANQVLTSDESACQCASGFIPALGTIYLTKLTCIPCNAGEYSIQGNTTCQTCPAGTYSSFGADNCTYCASNTFSLPGSNNCTVCPNNSEASTDHSTCVCGAGFSASGSTINNTLTCSLACSGANQTATADGSACQCAAGFISALGTSYPANLTCTPCNPGEFSLPGNATCQQCPAGTYSLMADGSCSNCTGNTYSLAGAASCTTCPSNTEASNDHSTCLCAGGTTASGSMSNNTLVCSVACSGANQTTTADGFACQCMAGFIPALGTTYPTNLTCTPCNAGDFSALGDSTCQQCPPGTYSLAGSGICSNCSANTYSVAGSTGCTACPNNSQASADHSTCACGAGFTSSGSTSNNNLTCNLVCGANQEATAGNTTCTCMLGFVPAPGTSWPSNLTCVACGPHQVPSGDASACQCNAGYIPQPGTSFLAGSLACTACGAGQYSSSGDLTCTNCTGGQYSSDLGSSACLSCPDNSTAATDHTGCTCLAGCTASYNGSSLGSCNSCGPPAAAVDVYQTTGAIGSITVSWSGGSGDADSYILKCVTEGNGVCGSGVVAGTATVAGVVTSATVASGLSGGTTYECYVIAYNSFAPQGVCSGALSTSPLLAPAP